MGNQSSKQHKDKSKKYVHWKSAEPPQAPGKPFLLPGIPTDEPDVVTIKWQKPVSDGGSTIMGYIVEHRRTGSPHWVRACPQLVLYTELSLSGLEPGWRYQFRIIAENAVGKSSPSEASEPLTVTLQRNAVTAPKFTIELEDFNGIENEKVEFRVSAIGSPAPQISWFKDGFEIFSSRRTKIITENDSSVLVFYQAALTDEGEIKCTATNRAGYALTKAKLTIEAPPKIRLPRQYEDGLIIEAEEVIRLKVGIAGRPVPSVIWTHNGEMISSDGRYEITNTDKNSMLKITNSNRTDRGEYNLRAINKLGEDNSSFLVTITARPTPPGKVDIKLLLGKTVTLSWAPPEDDGGCKIGNYIVEYFRIGWNVWLKAATCRQLAVTLNDIIEGSEYKFRVKAENPYGVSDPSEESSILFIPDPKRGILMPKDVKDLTADVPLPPVAPKRKNLSPSPSRSKPNNNYQAIKLSPVPQSKLNTKIFDDDTMGREMSYGTSDDFYKFREAPATIIQEKSGLELQVRQLKNAKNNVKFQFNVENDVKEPIYANLTQQQEAPKLQAIDMESKSTGKRTFLDLSKTNGSNAPSSIPNSSEFMLVLYPERESKNSNTNDSFEMDMENFFSPPPPLSQSAPELNVMPPEAPILRAAVSSTELLYERAMARFYKAVEYEESENARKRSISVEQETRRRSFSVDQEIKRLSIHADPQEAALTRLRINSLTENERRSSLRRRLSGESPNLHLHIPKRLNLKDDDQDFEDHKTAINTIKNELNTPEMLGLDRASSPLSTPITGEEQFSDDYTDSTQSSDDEEELDEDVVPRRSRIRSNDDEIQTYHPAPRMLSPYRQPENHEAVEVLMKPMAPLPDPNFVPKPILKRPADGRRSVPYKPERKTNTQSHNRSPSPTSSSKLHRKSVEIDEIPKIIQDLPEFIAQRKKDEVQEVPIIKVEEPKIQEPLKDEANEPEFEPPIDPDLIFLKYQSDLTKKKVLERRQNSLEENKVMASFYGDMIKDLSARPAKPKVPIYMDPEALKQLEIEEEELQNDSGVTSASMSPQSTLGRPISPQPLSQSIIRETSPSVLERRASEAIPRPFSPQSLKDKTIYGRRASDSSKSKAISPVLSSIQNTLSKEARNLSTANSMINKMPPQMLNGSVLQKHDGQISSTSSIDDVHYRGRQTKSATGTIPKRRNQSHSISRDNATNEVPSSINQSRPNEQIMSRREKSSSRTRNRSESKSPSTMTRRIIINKYGPPPPKLKAKSISPASQSPLSSRTVTPSEQLQEQVKLKVKSSMTYVTDLSIFLFATYIYFFKSALFALPILILLLYRQVPSIPEWMKRKKS